jgi:hypothetical protein
VSFKVGDKVVRKANAGTNCGVREGDERDIVRIGRDGFLALSDDEIGANHDPENYELVAEVESGTLQWQIDEIAKFCLGDGVPYNHDDVMQYLREYERWNQEARNFRSDASLIMQGGEPQSDLPKRTADRSVYAEVLDALKDRATDHDALAAANNMVEDLADNLREADLKYELLADGLRDALGIEAGSASVERMLEMVEALRAGDAHTHYASAPTPFNPVGKIILSRGGRITICGLTIEAGE